MIALRFAESCRLIAGLALILFLSWAFVWMVKHSHYVISQETIALSQLNHLGDENQAPPKVLNPPANLPGGNNGTTLVPQDFRVPIIGRLLSADLGPAALLVVCIICIIVLVLFVVWMWNTVVTEWMAASTCSWSSFIRAGLF
jgi:hypothetical protein